MSLASKYPLTTKSSGFDVSTRYPWAYAHYKTSEAIAWRPEEIPFGDDVKDWDHKLTDNERALLTNVFRFFTQADCEVGDNYMERYSLVFQPIAVKMMLLGFAKHEATHVDAYSQLVRTVGMPDSTFSEFMRIKAMADKANYMDTFGVDTEQDVARTLAMFAGATEGLQLFSSFAILLNFPRRNLMKGMGQVVSWSQRDESLHCKGCIQLFHAWTAETRCLTRPVIDDIRAVFADVVRLEDAFIDTCFASGGVEGIEASQVKTYIRYWADKRLGQLTIEPMFGVTKNPLPWVDEMVGGREHANFFETAVTEYTQYGSTGTWDETWDKMFLSKETLDDMRRPRVLELGGLALQSNPFRSEQSAPSPVI